MFMQALYPSVPGTETLVGFFERIDEQNIDHNVKYTHKTLTVFQIVKRLKYGKSTNNK